MFEGLKSCIQAVLPRKPAKTQYAEEAGSTLAAEARVGNDTCRGQDKRP